MRVFTWEEQRKFCFVLFFGGLRKIGSFQSPTSMLNSATMNKHGMVTKIHTRIRADPFTANYELVGKELGRWVLFVAPRNPVCACSVFVRWICYNILINLWTNRVIVLDSLHVRRGSVLIEHFQILHSVRCLICALAHWECVMVKMRFVFLVFCFFFKQCVTEAREVPKKKICQIVSRISRSYCPHCVCLLSEEASLCGVLKLHIRFHLQLYNADACNYMPSKSSAVTLCSSAAPLSLRHFSQMHSVGNTCVNVGTSDHQSSRISLGNPQWNTTNGSILT